MTALRIWMLLWMSFHNVVPDVLLPHDASKIVQRINSTLPYLSSLNQTSGGEPLTTSHSQPGATLNSSPVVNVYGTLVTSTAMTNSEDFLVSPTPTEDKTVLTMAAVGVTSFIVILVVIVIILVSVVSLKFRCHHCKNAEDKQKPQQLTISYSCSDDADSAADKKNITLVSMKNLNTNNSKGIMKTVVTHDDKQ